MSDNYKPTSSIAQLGGAQKKNGHKQHCICHICENIKNKIKRGGYKEDEEKEQLKRMGGSKKKNGHKLICECPICKNMKNCKKNKSNKYKKGGESNTKTYIETLASDDDYDELDSLKTNKIQNIKSGGTKKYKKKKSKNTRRSK